MSPGLVKMTLLLHPEEAARLEAYCHESGHKKSTLVATLVRKYLDSEAAAARTKSRSGSRSPEPREKGA